VGSKVRRQVERAQLEKEKNAGEWHELVTGLQGESTRWARRGSGKGGG